MLLKFSAIKVFQQHFLEIPWAKLNICFKTNNSNTIKSYSQDQNCSYLQNNCQKTFFKILFCQKQVSVSLNYILSIEMFKILFGVLKKYQSRWFAVAFLNLKVSNWIQKLKLLLTVVRNIKVLSFKHKTGQLK